MKFKTKLTTILLCIAMLAGTVSCDSTEKPEEMSEKNTTSVSTVTETATIEAETASPEELRLAEILENKTQLRFNENGEFRILVLADLHIPGDGIPEATLANVRTIVEKEKPNLVILAGDNVVASEINTEEAFRSALLPLSDYLTEKQIYWMHVYGNHDCEVGVSLDTQQAIYESFDYCLSKDVDKSITGVGNYVVPIYGSASDDVKFAVWGIDSGNYISAAESAAMYPMGMSAFKGYSGTQYGYIHYDQIKWYEDVSMLLETCNNGELVPGLMAFHIPLQESYSAWLNRRVIKDWTGDKVEDICASAFNSGLFSVLLYRNDVKAVVFGHDHSNDFMVNYNGIRLCYAASLSTTAYGGANGARVFVIKESDPADVQTYISYLHPKTE